MMGEEAHLVIFTDLDGTLVDYCYSFEKALPALNILKERGIPLVICSSKTRAEIELYRTRLENLHPFISENGGGIFMPSGYFRSARGHKTIKEGPYDLIALGTPYGKLREAVCNLKDKGFEVKGFGDMDAAGVSAQTGLSLPEAELALKREFDEPFFFEGGEDERRRLLEAIEEMGLRYTEGRLSHIMGETDKGKAVRILKELYSAETGSVITAALGDGPNDIEMLAEADYPIVVQRPDGSFLEAPGIENLRRAEGAGPEGWRIAVERLLMALSV